MSKAVKEVLISDYKKKLEGVNDAAIISIRGVSGHDATKLRKNLRGKKVRVTLVRNSLALKAFEGTGLTALEPLMSGSSAVVYGGSSVVEIARELVAILKEMPAIELKGAVLDGTLFKGEAGVKELSKFPTRAEAQGQTVALLLGPAKKLAAQIKGPGANIAGLVKAIEAKLEKGEAIEKKAG
jgi:large subunit ribosomal protein L10